MGTGDPRCGTAGVTTSKAPPSGSLFVPDAVLGNYERPNLLAAICDALAASGLTPQTVTSDDLAAIDQFHIGGRAATKGLIDQLRLGRDDYVIDLGSGLGGTARLVASEFGCRVVGVDLTEDYVAAGTEICRWQGLDGQVALHCGSIMSLPFPDKTFSAACMLHVGMNIPDKIRLFQEVARVLKPGARFGLYDVMTDRPGELAFPLPWTKGPEGNAIARVAAYREALEQSGFAIVAQCDRQSFALDYFAAQQSAAARRSNLGLQLLMGERRQDQVRNMIAAVKAGLLAPVELVAVRCDFRA